MFPDKTIRIKHIEISMFTPLKSTRGPNDRHFGLAFYAVLYIKA
ncbi:hypothetical protein SAMN05428947_10967 [Mucilaginibacter sp. OK283]|nr:hypothetical protein SAMN05428947_10967 [Mucilaginibacter sp. OK283]